MAINQVAITGNLTKDAELRNGASGISVLVFSVAVNDSVKNKQTGEYEHVPNYFDCVMFGNRAAAIAKYMSKGKKVSIGGRLKYTTWQTKEGQKRSKVEIIALEVEFLAQKGQQDQLPGVAEPEQDDGPVYDDIPF